MRTWHTTLAAGVLGTLVAVAVPGQAQQVTMGTRFHTLSDSFYENSSINWSGTYLWPINNTKNTQFSNVFPGVTFSFGPQPGEASIWITGSLCGAVYKLRHSQ